MTISKEENFSPDFFDGVLTKLERSELTLTNSALNLKATTGKAGV